jgi:hypothetical protein
VVVRVEPLVHRRLALPRPHLSSLARCSCLRERARAGI